MAVVNAGIVVVFFVGAADHRRLVRLAATGFAVLLLTLLVTLYDRFRPYYAARRPRAEPREGG